MWYYEKRLEYPVKISTPNAKIAQIILSQYGGLYCSNLKQADFPAVLNFFFCSLSFLFIKIVVSFPRENGGNLLKTIHHFAQRESAIFLYFPL